MSTVDTATVVIVLGCKANLRISGKVPVWGNLEKFDVHGDGSVESMPL